MTEPVKKRINLSIDPQLHAWATGHAEKLGTNFSAYVTDLLKRDREHAAGEVTLTAEERAGLRSEIAADVLKALLARKRGG